MEKDKIFFGEEGLTSTSANFIANLAKEAYQEIEQALSSTIFYTTTISLLAGGEEKVVREGINTVSSIPSRLDSIAQLKSLIAWLREAIKAKDRLANEAKKMSYENFGIEVPECPDSGEYIDEDDIIATLNIKQRNRYYYLETLCAQMGSYIHPTGAFAQQRKKLQEVENEPYVVTESGRDTIIYHRTPTVPTQEVEDAFMTLQQKYREYQAELNSIKHDIQLAVEGHNLSVDLKYQEKMKEYNNAQKIASATLSAKVKEAVDAVSKLKIIIPDSLKPIYDKVQKLGK